MILLAYILFLSQIVFPETPDIKTTSLVNYNVGSEHCRRCHESVFKEWQADPERKSCETCHGPGLNHVLAPTKKNVSFVKDPTYIHGEPIKAPITTPKDKLTLELFVMSYCPYGIAAINTLLPIIKKWNDRVQLTIHYIAHRRGSKTVSSPETDDLPSTSDKCETNGAVLDGSDKYVSLHGLNEVEEDIRQIIIANKFKERLIPYLMERNRNIEDNWISAAKQAKFSEAEIKQVEDLSDSRLGDSLFEASMDEAEKRGVSGSPTLFINSREYGEAISPYPVERFFCQESRKDGPCKAFPECGFDFDCTKMGMEGTCISPMKSNAKCTYKKAVRFTVTVVNDETCRICHTGNILMETIRRFPGAQFQFVPIKSDSGALLIKAYNLETYPAFIFDSTADKSNKFKAIKHTFKKVKDKYILEDYVIKSYHYLNRPHYQNEIAIFGSFQNPPFIEMLRDFKNVITDTLINTRISFHPFAVKNDKNKEKSSWYEDYDSPYGKDEVRAGINQVCVLAKYPIKKALEYMVCRGHDVENRFEEKIPENKDEWKVCAGKAGIDTIKILSCENGEEGKKLFEQSIMLEDSLRIEDPGPLFLINNDFKVSGYNNFIRKIILKELY